MKRLGEKLQALLFEPVDIAALVIYRVLFGVMMAYDAFRYVWLGWVYDHYVEPQLLFKFFGFFWVEALPGWGMYAVHGLMIASAICLAAGFYYRLSAVLYFLAHTYCFLVAAEYYLNHAYLISTVALVMVFLPAHRAASVDVVRRPSLKTQTIHAWPYWVLIGLVGIVYTYGSIAKITPDWLAGVPARQWLAHRADDAIWPINDILRHETTVMFVAYGGILFDGLVTPALLWRRTRPFALAASVAFHLSNHYLFNIGVFPWFMLATTTLFLGWSWPRKAPIYGDLFDRWLTRIGGPKEENGGADAPASYRKAPAPPDEPVSWGGRHRGAVMALLATFFAFELLVPLRHHLYPHYVGWSEEGHNFSWRMKLRDKGGRWHLTVVDKATGERWRVEPSEQLHSRQIRKATGRPDMLLQYVHYLRDAYRRDYGKDVAIYADVFVSLNYRPEQRMIDPTVDLAQVEHSIWPSTWILPFENTPLPSPVRPADKQLGATAARFATLVARRQILAPTSLRESSSDALD